MAEGGTETCSVATPAFFRPAAFSTGLPPFCCAPVPTSFCAAELERFFEPAVTEAAAEAEAEGEGAVRFGCFPDTAAEAAAEAEAGAGAVADFGRLPPPPLVADAVAEAVVFGTVAEAAAAAVAAGPAEEAPLFFDGCWAAAVADGTAAGPTAFLFLAEAEGEAEAEGRAAEGEGVAEETGEEGAEAVAAFLDLLDLDLA